MSDDVCGYIINHRDIIVSVSRNWEPFARANAGGSRCSSENVVGHLLWDFIQDYETRHLYKEVFKRVRAGRPFGPIPFRCDSPQERRFLKLFLSPLPGGKIEITSTTVRTERRDPVKLLDKDMPRSREFITICSICKNIAIAKEKWVDIEKVLGQLRFFEAEKVPRLSHGLSPVCYQAVMADLKNLPAPGGGIDPDGS